jgi:hypothetical protein
MSIQLMHRTVVSNTHVAKFCQIACSLVAVLVLVLGFRRLEQMELTEPQLYSAATETLLLSAAFIGLALFFSRWHRVP